MNLTTIYNDFKHYFGVCLVLLVLYGIGSALIEQYHGKVLTGPQVAVTAPQPQNASTKAIEDLAAAMKDKSVADALAGRAADLSASQSTIANALSKATGLNAALSGALAEGLTRPAPKVQVLQVGTDTQTHLVAPAKAQDDDSIKADLKDVLAHTKLEQDVHTTVAVKWDEKPFSPIFALYQNDGSSGIGLTLKRFPLYSIDALATVPSGDRPGVAAGLGLEHIFKGTSAGIGVDARYNFALHGMQYGLFVGVHS